MRLVRFNGERYVPFSDVIESNQARPLSQEPSAQTGVSHSARQLHRHQRRSHIQPQRLGTFRRPEGCRATRTSSEQ